MPQPTPYLHFLDRPLRVLQQAPVQLLQQRLQAVRRHDRAFHLVHRQLFHAPLLEPAHTLLRLQAILDKRYNPH